MSTRNLFSRLGIVLAAAMLASPVFAQHGHYRQPCPCPSDAYVPEAADDGDEAPAPDEAVEDLDLADAQDVASAPTTVAHNMIGDFFGNGIYLSADPLGIAPTDGSLPIAGGDRRYKVSDNIMPFPTDRIFFNFHQFNNAVTDVDDVSRDISRFTFGFEKTLFCEQASVELRVPFVEGLNSDQTEDGDDNTGTEFGNVVIVTKVLLYNCCGTAVTAGVGISLPTADDANFYNDADLLTQSVENEAVYLTPYVGMFKDHGCGWFSQGYAAVDFETNSNSLLDGGGTEIGELESATLLFVDLQIGKWIYRNDCCCSGITGIAPVVELHYTTTLDEGDVSAPAANATSFGSADILNLTAGVRVEIGCGMLNVYGAVPLDQTEREIGSSVKQASFDSEFGVQYIRFF